MTRTTTGTKYLEFEKDIVRIELNVDTGYYNLYKHNLEESNVTRYIFKPSSSLVLESVIGSVDEFYDAESSNAQSGIAVSQGIAETAANAFKKTITGADEVNITDASPLIHTMGITAKARNLLNFAEKTPIKAEQKIDFSDVKPPFSVSLDVTITNNPSSLSSTFIRFHFVDGTTQDVTLSNPTYTTKISDNVYHMHYYRSTLGLAYITIKNWCNAVGTIDWMQITEGTNDSPYAPYIENIEEVSIVGIKKKDVLEKNIFIPGDLGARTINGVTFTVSEDGTIYLNGEATANTVIDIGTADVIGGLTYTLSGAPIEFKDNQYVYLAAFYGSTDTNEADDFGEGATFNAPEDYKGKIQIWIFGGTVLNNVAITPQIEEGETKTEYEPYIDADLFGLNTEGETTIPSKYFNLRSDTPGVDIECRYNRDANAAYKELANAIIALGGSL